MEALLKKLQQIIFLEKIQKLPKEKQKKIFLQIKKFDQQLLWQQKQDFLKRSSVSTTYTPWTKVAFPKKEDATVGRFLLQKAKIAFVLLAAGQASRLDFHKPKGCFPISPVKKKSLFQVFAEKILAAQQKYQQKFCIACMLSPMNEEATIAFLQKHQFFGLEKKQWIFFTQNVVPLLDEEGNWFLTSDDLIAIGPDGNGSMLLHLFTSKVQEIFTKNNIEVLSIFSIDNPLVNPCEEAMIGYHYRQKNDVTVRCIAKEKNMGLLAKDNNTLKIVEYIYSNKNAKTFLWANTNHFCVSLSFVKKMFSQSFLLPYHFSKRNCKVKIFLLVKNFSLIILIKLIK